MSQPNRLADQRPPEFSCAAIDPARSLRFTLDGRTIVGFEGDTVLSALLADGVDTAGTRSGFPVALDAHSAPAIALDGNAKRPDLAMPMALCPAMDGAAYVSIGTRRTITPAARLMKLFSRPSRSLGLDLDAGQALPGPWIDTPAARRESADVVVVGGGVAGLSAALRAARNKAKVVLIERDPILGGVSEYFGKAEGEPAPDALIATLVAKVAAASAIKVYTGTQAFDCNDGVVDTIGVSVEGGVPRPERLAFSGKHVILATGCAERLPIFPGNRLPGVRGSTFSWRMAAHFNVWPGRSAHVHTTTNVGYRMALLGSGAGIDIRRSSDPRAHPQTRFIEFCKAYGFRLGWGAAPATVLEADGSLEIRLADIETGAMQDGAIHAESLILSGGWQPELALWLRAGGTARWDHARQCLVPVGHAGSLAFAGAAAGFLSLPGCAASGEATADWLLSGTQTEIADPQIDPIFETPDGMPFFSHPRRRDLPPAHRGITGPDRLPEPPLSGLKAFLTRTQPTVADPAMALDPLDVAGAIASGALAAEAAPAWCAERCILPRGFAPRALPAQRDEASGLPVWLAGRFGPGQSVWQLVAETGRVFDPGCLLFPNTDETDPLAAIGVILGETNGTLRALLAHRGIGSGDAIYVRDGLTCTAIRLDQKVVLQD